MFRCVAFKKAESRIEKNQCSQTICYSARTLEVIVCRLEDKAKKELLILRFQYCINTASQRFELLPRHIN